MTSSSFRLLSCFRAFIFLLLFSFVMSCLLIGVYNFSTSINYFFLPYTRVQKEISALLGFMYKAFFFPFFIWYLKMKLIKSFDFFSIFKYFYVKISKIKLIFLAAVFFSYMVCYFISSRVYFWEYFWVKVCKKGNV